MLRLEYAPERSGIFSGRQAIEKWFAHEFMESHVTDTEGPLDQINPVDAGMWARMAFNGPEFNRCCRVIIRLRMCYESTRMCHVRRPANQLPERLSGLRIKT